MKEMILQRLRFAHGAAFEFQVLLWSLESERVGGPTDPLDLDLSEFARFIANATWRMIGHREGLDWETFVTDKSLVMKEFEGSSEYVGENNQPELDSEQREVDFGPVPPAL